MNAISQKPHATSFFSKNKNNYKRMKYSLSPIVLRRTQNKEHLLKPGNNVLKKPPSSCGVGCCRSFAIKMIKMVIQ